MNHTVANIDLLPEINFKTARSGGKGGQNVNKVETMVEGKFHVGESAILSEEQKKLVQKKLASRINSSGFLQVKSQVYRSQLDNKKEVIKKIHQLVQAALKREKKRIATKPSAVSKKKRLESKKKLSENKQHRQKIRHFDSSG